MNICADDYGLDNQTNAAIIALTQKRKLGSVSVLIKYCSLEDVRQLKGYAKQIDIGLHLDIFKKNPIQNYLNCVLNPSFLQTEINTQISLFKNQFGFEPRYYDGHMHCQLYPVIRSQLLKTLALEKNNFYIRSCTIPTSIKSTPYVVFLGFLNKSFIKLINKYGFSTNNHLYGSFNNHLTIEESFNSFTLNAKKNDIFFFHPSLKPPRKQEYEYLAKT